MSSSDTRIPSEIRHKLVQGVSQNDRAIVVGRRDGIIEWANPAWTRVTGYPLHESVSKPVTSFLENIDIEPGLVSYVANCFAQGKVCEVDLPVETPLGESRHIALRVEPLFDAQGEPSDFIAIATDVTRRRGLDRRTLDPVDLSEVGLRVASRHASALGPNTAFDLALPADLPEALGDTDLIEEIAGRAVCRGARGIGDDWGTVTLWSGVLGCDAGPLYYGDLFRGLPEGLFAYLEVHDTGGPPSERAVLPSEPLLSVDHAPDVMPFEEARERIRRCGGELRVQTIAGSGTSVVILLPFCGAG